MEESIVVIPFGPQYAVDMIDHQLFDGLTSRQVRADRLVERILIVYV